MEILFIITQVKKPSWNGIEFNSVQASQTMYKTYPEAEAAIKDLGIGIFQIQKVFVNQ